MDRIGIALLALLVGLVVGGILGWALARRQCREEIEQMRNTVLDFDTKYKKLDRATRLAAAEAASYAEED